MSVPKKLSFVMFIHDTTIHGGKIDIPPNVVRDYSDCFSNPVTLGVPTGDEWQVSLHKRANSIQLVGGWKQFVDFYCLKPGCSVVFKHDGGRHTRFLVSMFGCNGMRIDYPVRKNGLQAPLEPKDETVDKANDADHHPQRGTMKKGSCSRSYLAQAEEGDGSPSPIKKKPRLRLDICTEGMFIKGYKPKGRATPDLIASRALKASVDFTSQYPFFKIVLALMDIQRNNLDIPYNFVKKLPDRTKTDATLEVGSRSWKVILSKFSSNKTGRLSKGWLPFARDNGLRVGDICIFELISARKFCVNLFKGVAGQ